MAYGYAKSTGKIGVYCVGSGSRCTQFNGRTMHRAQCPGYVYHRPGTERIYWRWSGHGMLHELPEQLNTLRTITKWAARINRTAEAPAIMADAFKNLTSGRIQPVAIEVPLDILGQKGVVDMDFPDIPGPAYNPDPDRISQAADMIRQAKSTHDYGRQWRHRGEGRRCWNLPG